MLEFGDARLMLCNRHVVISLHAVMKADLGVESADTICRLFQSISGSPRSKDGLLAVQRDGTAMMALAGMSTKETQSAVDAMMSTHCFN